MGSATGDNSGEHAHDDDLNATPWKLCLINSRHPLKVFIYFATHKEARDQEDISVSKGWSSAGIVWYN